MADSVLTNSGTPISLELLEKKFPEWLLFERLLTDLKKFGKIHELGETQGPYCFPLKAISFGNPDPTAPSLGLFGGVHGLERIGAQVVLALLKSFSELILWDKLLQHSLEQIRIVFFPLVNPVGVMNRSRANPNGVDLMRNAPVCSDEKPSFLIGGHRISPLLPWYRGNSEVSMERESQAVIDVVKTQLIDSKVTISVDFHSGFGIVDRIWFPYAKSTRPFPQLAEMFSLKQNLDRSFPNHFYQVEPQSKSYTTDGDLWDYSFDLYHKHHQGKNVYIPLSLEMGSWLWVKKNPLQVFSALGPFNPVKPHRQKRILRRHITLFDFLIRSLVSSQSWTNNSTAQRENLYTRAMELWYD